MNAYCEHDKKLTDHHGRLKELEERHEKEDETKEENRKLVKKAVVGSALGGSGATGLAIAAIKGFIHFGGK